MTQEDKKLLLADLCARLPYGVKCEVNTHTERLDSIDPFEEAATFGFQSFDVSEVKPYLRPMSSMTEEEKKELEDEIDKDFKLAIIACKENDITKSTSGFYKIDWLNAHHFDYRELIPKGLAIEAPEGMYN